MITLLLLGKVIQTLKSKMVTLKICIQRQFSQKGSLILSGVILSCFIFYL